MKACNTCAVELPDDRFSPGKGRCKACCAMAAKEYRERNSAEVARKNSERWKVWYLQNAERFKEYAKQYRKTNIEKVKEREREYRKNNTARREKQNDYYKTNKHEIAVKAAARTELVLPGYAARLIGLKAGDLPQSLLEMKRYQLAMRRMARQLKETLHESSTDTSGISGQPGRGDNARRLAADRGQQPAGTGPQGDQRHGRGSDGQRLGLDQQQPKR